MNNLPILIGCEESQTITKAFRAAGFDAYSCDLQPTRGNPDWHYTGDIMDVIPTRRWGLIILHPDCTAMTVSGNRWYGKGTPKNDKRLKQVEWTKALWELAKRYSDRVALENPKSVIFPVLRKMGAAVQYVQPHWFGHTETKETGFALHGLQELEKTNDVYEEMMELPKKERHKVWYMSPGENRKRDRSRTFDGVASAIVEQWG